MPSGYVRVWEPSHPAANRDGHVLEHRKVLLDAGHALPPGTHVHHINGNKQDNRVENLCVKAAADHAADHARELGFAENQHGRYPLRRPRACETCGGMFFPWKDTGRFCSRACSNRRHVAANAPGSRSKATEPAEATAMPKRACGGLGAARGKQ